MKKLMTLCTAAILLIAAAADPRAAVVLKIGSVAPARSPWDRALQEVAREWEKISGGQVQVKIYPGGIAGTEMDMIRKIRLGALQGGVFTNMGITKIERSVLVLNIPFMFDSQEEFEFVFDRMKSVFGKEIEDKGFKVILWTLAGWVHFFAKDPVIYPDDLKKFKVSVTQGDPELEQIWKKAGFQVVPADIKDLMVQLQSGAVGAAYLPALVAGSGQYFALIPHMLSMTLAPLVGGMFLSDRAWESVPHEFRQPMMDAVERVSRDLYEQTMDLEKEALATMKEHGLVVHDPPDDAMAKWRAVSAQGVEDLIGRAFPKPVYDAIMGHIREYRKNRGR
jgi:TRAP-type transport system periplasmic protein